MTLGVLLTTTNYYLLYLTLAFCVTLGVVRLSSFDCLTGDLEVLMSWSAIKVIGHTYIRTYVHQ